jgi:hypothetical protein
MLVKYHLSMDKMNAQDIIFSDPVYQITEEWTFYSTSKLNVFFFVDF